MARPTLRQQAAANADLILGGVMLAIDPSSTSTGYAVFEKGVFIKGGTLKYRGVVQMRLVRLAADISSLITDNYADIIAVERLRAAGGYSPVELIWSVGVVVAAAPLPFIEVSPASWKVSARELELEKSDANDAKAIGHRLVTLARDPEA